MALQSTAEPLDVARRSTRTMSSATKTELPTGEGVPFGDVRVPFRDRSLHASPLGGAFVHPLGRAAFSLASPRWVFNNAPRRLRLGASRRFRLATPPPPPFLDSRLAAGVVRPPPPLRTTRRRVAFRAKVRAFVESEIMPHTHEWDEKKSLPLELYKKTYEAGILPGVVGAPGPGAWAISSPVPGPANFDYFHELIILDEFGRCGSGVLWGLLEGVHIGLPPVLNFGSRELRDRVAPARALGARARSVCASPSVRRLGRRQHPLLGEAKRGRVARYVVSGEKKWITNGVWADFFTVAVRTGGPGMGGISLLLIEKTMPGVECKRMDCMGVWASGTTFITFDEVKVRRWESDRPRAAQGRKYVMHNFNHERWGFVVQAEPVRARVLRGGVQVRAPKADRAASGWSSTP